MARSFNDVLKEVTSKSDPQRKIVLGQISSLPGQQQADEASLDAKKTQAFDDILGGARQRGLGFSGIPLGEQAKYSATEYAPAVARMKTGFNERRATLESALADIGKSDYTTARSIFDADRTFAEQQRQFNLNYKLAQEEARRLAQAGGGGGGGGTPTENPLGGGGGGNTPKPQAVMQKRSNGGFNFTYGGQPISAAVYAQAKGINFFDLLDKMAKAGDKGASQYLKGGGNVSSGLVRALTWR